MNSKYKYRNKADLYNKSYKSLTTMNSKNKYRNKADLYSKSYKSLTTMNSKNKYRNKADLYSKFYYINPWLQWTVKTNIEIKLIYIVSFTI
jgi:hypothetical protein